ncbi:putative odorant receptor 85d isoform X2 [Sitodiplosis mosellana]|nr:putative odorant receptor 85d isoform X2 [Sitodiplosis mosellana]
MENPKSKSTYVKLNENIEKWTGVFYSIIVELSVIAVLMPHLIISFYLYFATDLGREAFSLPFQVWTPFDWRTPIGYLIIFTFECSAAYYTTHMAACCIGILVASCCIIFTFCNEINSEIHALDESNKAEEYSVEPKKRVADMVEFHATAKQLVFDMDDIYAFIVIGYFLWSLSTICCNLLLIQIESERGEGIDPLQMIKPLFQTFWSFAVLFLICEFGQTLTNHFDQLKDVIYDCDWTAFPKDMQKILPIIIQNTQRPVVLQICEDFSCSRESFKKVVNAGFSFFMVFREFR